MEDQKRVQLAVGLSLVVLVGWTFVTNKLSPPPAPPPAAVSAPAAGAAPPLAAPAAGAATAATAGTTAPAAAALPEEQRTIVERKGLYRVELTNYGAAITSFEIDDPKYFSRDAR